MLQDPEDFVWCNHGVRISRAAHVAKHRDLYCDNLAKAVKKYVQMMEG